MAREKDQDNIDFLRVREAAFGWQIIQTDLSGETIKVTMEAPKSTDEDVGG
ncbi:hypothetical protein LCGC14_1675030 [marine sediment metagenome]|uniref:Uncharacterized protein n=1 Tax=marine sediment metagenome TaxID=412755 RepID=A0A0F9HR07_9ZZZZ